MMHHFLVDMQCLEIDIFMLRLMQYWLLHLKVSGSKSSGTWEGVIENLTHQWSPLYVIGKSEGVLRLLAKIMQNDTHHWMPLLNKVALQNQKMRVILQNKSRELIKSALEDGYDRSIIEKTFKEQLAKSFESEILNQVRKI